MATCFHTLDCGGFRICQPGTLFLEKSGEWEISQRFSDVAAVEAWQQSVEYLKMIEELRLLNKAGDLVQDVREEADLRGGITEVFVTRSPLSKRKLSSSGVRACISSRRLFPASAAFMCSRPCSPMARTGLPCFNLTVWPILTAAALSGAPADSQRVGCFRHFS